MNCTPLRLNTLRTSSIRSSVAILCADPDDGIDEILSGLQTFRRRQPELVADLTDVAPVQPPLRHLQLIIVGGDSFHLRVLGLAVPHDRILPKIERRPVPPSPGRQPPPVPRRRAHRLPRRA